MLSPRFQNDGRETLKLNALQLKMRDQVAEKVTKGVYPLEDVVCAVCDSSKGQIISEKDRYGLKYSVKVCDDCGLVRTDPRMTQEAYNDFYNNEYRQLYVGKEVATESFFYTQTRKGKGIISLLDDQKLIARTDWKGKFVLEVGCGAGGLLHEFKKLGAEVLGTDLGESYINWGKKHKGLDLRTGFLKDMQLERTPDLIIYSHVMEHILDPIDELQHVRLICNEDCLLYIEVPGIKAVKQNFRSDLLRFFQNAHTWHFSLSSLTNLLSRAGFSRVYGTDYVRSIWKKTEDKNVITSDLDEVMFSLQTTEENRNSLGTKFQNLGTDLRYVSSPILKAVKRLLP